VVLSAPETPRITSPMTFRRFNHMPLLRTQDDRLLGGVCGGIARWLGWDPTLVRVLYVLISIFSAAFPGTIVYLVLWAIMPWEPK
jgi:phage shock protein C